MKVITMITKTDAFCLKGETRTFDNISKIVEKETTVELIRSNNYAAILNKDFNRIIAVEW